MGERKLLPCPICNEIFGRMIQAITPTQGWFVQCDDSTCESTGPIRGSRADAIAAWNTRPAPALTPAQQAAEEMCEALRGIIAALELGGYMKRGEFYYYGVHDPAMTEPLTAARNALAKAGKP